MTQSKWLCSLPWTGFSNDPDGKVRPCCLFKDYIKQDNGDNFYVQTHKVDEIFSSNYMTNLRQRFRNGEKPEECIVCIKDELNNYTSKRQRYLETYMGSLVDYSTDPKFPMEYQMILSNACNLKCRSCSPSHSNLWQSEFKHVNDKVGYPMPHGQSGDKKSVLWQDRKEWMKHLKRLEIVGGEPFYIKQWLDLWEELINEKLSDDIIVDLCSNGTIYSGDTVEWLSNNFKSLGVGLSIDGIGKTYNYLRHPGNWDDVSKNILQYHKLSSSLKKPVWFQYSHTIGWVNAWELPEFHSWVKQNTPRFRIWNNIIHSPRHMSIVMIPDKIKDMIKDKWNSYDWGEYQDDVNGIINFMYSEQPSDEEIQNEYKNFIKHDKFRNENILDIIPNEFEYLKMFFV